MYYRNNMLYIILLVQNAFWFCCWFLPCLTYYLAVCPQFPNIWGFFHIFFCSSFLIYFLCGQKTCFNFLYIGPEYDMPWFVFCIHLERICILLLLGGVFCKCQLDQIGWYILNIPLLLFGLVFYQFLKEQPWCLLLWICLYILLFSVFSKYFLEKF